MHWQRCHVACLETLATTNKAPDRAWSPNSTLVAPGTVSRQHTTRPTRSKTSTRTKQKEHDRPLPAVPDELGKSAFKIKKKLTAQGFYSLVDRTRGRYKLEPLPHSRHKAAPLLNHLRDHGAPVVLTEAPSPQRLRKQILKGVHPTA